MEGLYRYTLCPTGSGFRLEALDSDSESVSSNDVPLPIRHTEEKKVWGSGCSDADIEEKTKLQYKEKYGSNFVHFLAWKVLKDNPKFTDPKYDVRGTKKTNVSATREYVVSSNTEEDTGEEARVERPRPIWRNAVRRMGKGKGKANISVRDRENVDVIEKKLQVLEEQNKKKIELLTSLVKIKEYKILMRDTSKMTDEHLRIHLHMVDKIKKRWGL